MPRPRSVHRAASRRPLRLVEQLEDRVTPTAVDPSTILVRLPMVVVNPDVFDIHAGTDFAGPLPLLPGVWEVRLDRGVSVADALWAYDASPFVLDAAPNRLLSVHRVPNDPRYPSMWGLDNTGQTLGTPDADLDAPQAWDVFTGSSETVVAVLDTGVDYTHPDLAANMWRNPGEVAGDGVDNDANGFIDDVHGWDFANNDSNPMDDHSHGTHVSGTIGAVGDNNLGVTGVAWDVRIMALKFLDATGNGTVANAIRALGYAVANGATVSNNSYGGSSAADSDPLFLEAIRNAAAADHIFVAGAGNSGTNNDAAGFYPANFDADNIIAVAATDHNDALASFSNYGAATVDVAAPGVDVLSTLPGNAYGNNSGTSMASPHVAGVVALVRGLNPNWNYQQVIDRVLGTVDYLPALDGRLVTAGRVNAARALLDADGPRVVGSDPSGGVGGVVGTVRLVFNEPVNPATFGVGDVVGFTGPGGPIAVTSVTPVAGSLDRKFDVAFAPQVARGTYALVLGPDVTDRTGNRMDQDGDGVLGEVPDDRFTASFTIGDQYVFRSTDTPVAMPFFATPVASLLTVAEDVAVADLDVRITVTSAEVGFVGLTLVSPAGTRVSLVPMTGNALGTAYRDTVFDDEALAPIGSGAAPFTGSYRPAAPLSAVDGQSALGTWRLEGQALFGGTIESWDLRVVAAPPRLSVADVTVAEGDAGTTLATFTVKLSNAIDQPVTVGYATADGTALAGSDYDAAADTLTFAPGETVKSFTVAVRGDTADEPDETYLVNLGNPVNATISDGQAVGTITNDELAVAVNDVTVIEGNAGTVSATFTVSLSAPSSHPVTVTYATAPGTAAANVDYVTTGGTFTFNPGETSRTVVVTVKPDNRYERGETFLLNLAATDALLGDGQGVGTILNDDPVPVMAVADASVLEGASGTRNLNFLVTLTSPSDDPVTVAYATADGTAAAGSDYTVAGGVLTFAAGQTSRTVSVVVSGDTAPEPGETLTLILSGATNSILMDGLAVGTILGDDVSVSADDLTVTETDAGTFAVAFPVRLSAPVSYPVTVNYAAANGTASQASDYLAAAGSVTFAPGEVTKAVTVLGIGDTTNEDNETFVLNLSGPVNAVLADAQGVATVLDNADPVPLLTVTDPVVTEGHTGTRTLSFTARLSAASGKRVTVAYATADDTAAAGSDYQPAAGTLTFNPGAVALTVNVIVTGDAIPETDEQLTLNLSGAASADLAADQAIGTITDDDSLVVDDVTVAEGDDGAALALFDVRLLAPRGHVVTVNYTTANGTAVAGSDYLHASGTLTFQPGQTVQTIAVPVFGNRHHEADETFYLNLSGPVGALIADGQGKATVVNDDPLPQLTVGGVTLVEGNSGTRAARFTLTLSEPSGQTVVVPFATTDGTAVAGSDYQPRSGVLYIGAGTTTQAIDVTVLGDAVAEGAESFFLTLGTLTTAVVVNDRAEAVIFDDDPLPAVSVNDVTVTEGASGTKTIYFTVSLSAASTQTVTVQAATADGTATAGSDYVAKTELVTFTPGQTSKLVGVVVTGDAVPEPTETWTLTLTGPANAVLGDAQGVGTVLNDDTLLRVNDVTVAEGDDGTTAAVFTVSLTGPMPADEVRVNYAAGSGTAAVGSDFLPAAGVLVFAPGQTTRTVAVHVLGDTLSESTETLVLNLSGPVNATLADTQGVATILDDADPAPTLSVFDASVVEGHSGTRNLAFTLRLSAPSGKSVSVMYATAPGTATAGADYQTRTGTITIGPGSLTQTVTVTVLGDTAAEADETVLLNLSGAANATLTDAQAVGTIQDDDSLVVDDPTVVEGDDGQSLAVFAVRLLAPRDEVVTVNYATSNGTAASGWDYLPTSGTLSFLPGQTAQPVAVPVVGDRLSEADETFYVNLSGATGALLADAQGKALITDDDSVPALSVGDVTVVEGNAGARTVSFTVRLSEASGQAVTVFYATQDGTATVAGGDYQARTGTLTFGPGQTALTVAVTIMPDDVDEDDESFTLVLSNPMKATLANDRATATIVDDDALP